MGYRRSDCAHGGGRCHVLVIHATRGLDHAIHFELTVPGLLIDIKL